MQRMISYQKEPVRPNVLDALTREFLAKHDIGVLSTVGHDGWPHGAAVHYTFNNGHLYVLTRSDTQKARDIETNNNVAVTVYDVAVLETVQLIGLAATETDRLLIRRLFPDLTQLRRYGLRVQAPPVTRQPEGNFAIIRIHPIRAHFSSYAS